VIWIFGAWLLVLVLSGYVGLATILAAAVAPLYVAFGAPEGLPPPWVFSRCSWPPSFFIPIAKTSGGCGRAMNTVSTG